jgi:hypothetical protein
MCFRGDLAFASFRDHVRHGAVSNDVGRRTSARSEQTILYLAQWRVYDAD